ncbi:MAG: AAA family ATPase [Acidobacteria bacterium]|nr:AAA family ATPase [Acidobacteriota bacterium]
MTEPQNPNPTMSNYAELLPEPVDPPIVVDDLTDFLLHEFPPRAFLLEGLLYERALAMVHAFRGIGKTQLVLEMALAVATGGPFLKWTAPEPNGVLFIDGEMCGSEIQERIEAAARNYEPVKPGMFLIVTPDRQTGAMPDLGTHKGRKALEEHFRPETKLIIIDNLSSLVRSVKENEGDDWQPFTTWLISLRSKGYSVLLVHHEGKGGTQRGASKKEDSLDLSLSLKRPKDYTTDQGAAFIINFEKSRQLHDDQARPVYTWLTTTESGERKWEWEHSTFEINDQILDLKEQGKTVTEIARMVGLHKSNISRRLEKLDRCALRTPKDPQRATQIKGVQQ